MRSGRLLVLALSVVAVMVAGCAGSDSSSTGPLVGDWHGAIEIPNQPLEVGVTFGEDGSATIDIPVQGLADGELRDVNIDPAAVEFALADIPGDPKFHGAYDEDTDRITGDFTQSGQDFPLTLRRGTVAALVRPQEPTAPFPYESEEVSYRNGDLNIAGTLTTPEGDGPFPAILMISGSGAQDRNEEMMGHKPFLLLADTFTRAGYAVLRTDDRGVGGTDGELSQSTYADLAGDAAAGVRFLRARSDINPDQVGLFGHSEGGYLAPLVAAAPDSGVAFVVSMAGPSVPGWEVLVAQNKALVTAAGGTPEEAADQARFITEWTDLLRADDLSGAREYSLSHNESLPEDQRAPVERIKATNTPYMQSFVTYDPAPALSSLQIPVLAFFGGKDLQVLAEQNEQPMRDQLADNPDATVHTFPGLNHLMQPATTGALSEYSTIETTIAPEVLTYVTDWLKENVPTTA